MSSIIIVLDNSLNSPENNPPGSKQWVGGPAMYISPGILVDKTDTALEYTIDESITSLNTWYYDDKEYWQTGVQIDGPFINMNVIQLPKVKLGRSAEVSSQSLNELTTEASDIPPALLSMPTSDL